MACPSVFRKSRNSLVSSWGLYVSEYRHCPRRVKPLQVRNTRLLFVVQPSMDDLFMGPVYALPSVKIKVSSLGLVWKALCVASHRSRRLRHVVMPILMMT